jgi:hypothetical protein
VGQHKKEHKIPIIDGARLDAVCSKTYGAGGFGQEHTGTSLATNWLIIILAYYNNHTFRHRAIFLLTVSKWLIIIAKKDEGTKLAKRSKNERIIF